MRVNHLLILCLALMCGSACGVVLADDPGYTINSLEHGVSARTAVVPDAAPGYHVNRLPALPGGRGGEANAINDKYEIAGMLIDSSDHPRAVVWDPKRKVKTLPLPEGARSGWATDINDKGQIVGHCMMDEDGRYVGVLWEPDGTIVPIDDKVAHLVYPTAINEKGWVVGHFLRPQGGTRAFLWKPNKFETLSGLGDRDTQALDINDAGQVVGWSADARYVKHSILWEADGRKRDLTQAVYGLSTEFRGASPQITQDIIFTAINNKGQIAGTIGDADEEGNAFIWSEKDGRTDLGALKSSDGVVSSARLPEALNDAGQVVGSSDKAGPYTPAFLWSKDSGITILSSLPYFLLGAAPAWNGDRIPIPPTVGRDITNDGVIVGESSGSPVIWVRALQVPVPPSDAR